MADCIPYYEPGERISAINGSGSTIVGCTFVGVNGVKNTGDPRTINIKTAVAAAKAIGVAAWDTISGERVTVLAGPGMVVPVVSVANITAGQEVEVGAGGAATPFSAGIKAGVALDSATAPALAMIKLY